MIYSTWTPILNLLIHLTVYFKSTFFFLQGVDLSTTLGFHTFFSKLNFVTGFPASWIMTTNLAMTLHSLSFVFTTKALQYLDMCFVKCFQTFWSHCQLSRHGKVKINLSRPAHEPDCGFKPHLSNHFCLFPSVTRVLVLSMCNKAAAKWTVS